MDKEKNPDGIIFKVSVLSESENIGRVYRPSNVHIVKVYRGLDHVYLRLATFREILLSSSGKVNGDIFTIYS